MNAEELIKRYSMEEHVENGLFVEKHYLDTDSQRPASGSIYYYVSPAETTKFHSIDCDEYWCYVKGSPLEVWQIDQEGNITVSNLGIEEDCKPLIYLKKGVIFASKHSKKESEGTFLICITVPRFEYEGFKLYENDEIIEKYPQTKEFFKKD